MISNFAKNQKGGVSPQFAIFVSSIFLTLGSVLYFQSDMAYTFFDNLLQQVKDLSNS